MSMEPKHFIISMFPTVELQGGALEKLLDVFEKNPVFTPTHWGYDERTKIPYNHNEILIQAGSQEKTFSEVWLHSNKGVKYSGSFTLKPGNFGFANILMDKSLGQKHWEAFFALAESLAEILKPSYGVAHMMYPSPMPWTNDEERMRRWMHFCVQPTPVRVNPNGPIGLGHVTYFGAEIVQLFEEDFLMQGPYEAVKTEWGGLKLMLQSPLQKAEFSVQLSNWLEAMAYLESKKVLATPIFEKSCRTVSFSPGEAWQNRTKA